MICFNGKFQEVMPKTLSPLFDCCQFGLSTFETLRTYDDQIFHLKSHLDRLCESVSILGIEIPNLRKIKSEIEVNVGKLVSINKVKGQDQRIKIFLCSDFYWIMTQPLDEVSDDFYHKGVQIIDATFERPFSRAKYPNLAYPYFARRQSDAVFETIFFNNEGFLREGNISNVFAVYGNEVHTPSKNILQGVTREVVMKTAKKLKIPMVEREISRGELKKADEIFITNTTKEVVPVRKWNKWENKDFKISKRLRVNFCRCEINNKIKS